MRQGLVRPGTYLVAENLDRISRADEWSAMEFFSGLVRRGIRVVKLLPSWRTFDKQSGIAGIFESASDFSRSHGESVMKSNRCGDAWREKKKDARTGTPHGRKCPGWVELDAKTGRYKPRPKAIKAVNAAFRLVADENLALSAVCNRLTAAGHAAIGYSKQWSPGYLALLLSSRTVLGEYQPMKRQGNRRVPDGDPIPDYYPRAVSDELFARVQATRETGTKGGRRPRSAYPLAGLVVDARDGSKMYVREGNRHPSGPYFISRAALERRPGAVFCAFPVHYLTEALLSQMVELKEDELFSDPSGSKIAGLTRKLRGVEKLLAVATERHEADPEITTWADQMTKHDCTRRQLLAELAAARREAASPLPEAWAEAVRLMTRDEPGRLSAALRRCVLEIRLLVVEPEGKFSPKPAACQVYFKGGAVRSYAVTWNRRHWSTPAEGHVPFEVRSFAGPLAGVDLRAPESVGKFERYLAPLRLPPTRRRTMTIPVPPTDPLDDQLLLAAVRADLSGDDDYFRWFLRLAHADGRRTLTATFGAVQITSRLAPGPEAV